MAKRSLPSLQDAARILTERRTRPAHRPPPPAGKGLSRLVRDLDERFGQGPGALQARWSEIVGERIARQTEPVKFVKGRAGASGSLEIRVAGSSAAIIQHQATEILARVNLFLGDGAVGRLRIVQGPLKQRPAAAGPRRRALPPLDAGREAELEAALSRVPEGPMREALLRLGRGVYRRNS